MAKTYLSAVKYNIIAEFQIDGIVDKPDIIGAVFGQSEGLLGQEMDLKQLQQNGKIGRIEIETQTVNGKTNGTITVPSSMDMVQTSLLAAAIESVDKVGPCEARIQTKKIEDTRGEKRKVISSRAQELLKQFMQQEIPESQEMTSALMENVRTAKLVEYGEEKLPAGPDIETNPELIIVEGRADVLNLLKHGITNVVGMGGSQVPRELIELSKTKTVTAFVDGDRGGELNARQLCELAKIDFIARAPDGKEVEELMQKEINMSLRKRTTASEFQSKPSYPVTSYSERHFDRRETRFGTRERRAGGYRSTNDRRPLGGRGRMDARSGGRMVGRRGMDRGNRFGLRTGFGRRTMHQDSRMESMAPPMPPEYQEPRQPVVIEGSTQPTADEYQQLAPIMKELSGSLKARLLDEKNNTLNETNVRELITTLQNTPQVHTIVFDGIVTKRLADEAEKLGVQRLVGIKKGGFQHEGKIRILTLNA